ncbi:MAG: DUF692 family protein [Proteobacteria bacterium]|nr:DUF692 family protein [Pseudomonadota bacterium]
MRRIPVGFTLHPNLDFHRVAVQLLRSGGVQYIEIAPETAWRHNANKQLVPNSYARLFQEAAAAFDLPVVAHGVALSPCTLDPSDTARTHQWAERTAADALDYAWWTDHHGLTWAGENHALPIPALPTANTVEATAQRLATMQKAVPTVGLETSASYAHWGDPMLEAELQAQVAQAANSHILLDLHNVWTMAQNGGFSAVDWIAHLDLSRVIEIHISGGSPSDPNWGGGLRPMWLDAHDSSVPEPVWELLTRVLPHCPMLRGVTLERMEGTAGPEDVDHLGEELRRLNTLCSDVPSEGAPRRRERPLLPELPYASALSFERGLGPALRSASPVQAVRDLGNALPAPHREAVLQADADGLRLSAMLIAKLRFERILNGVEGIDAALDTDAQGFTRRFSSYHRNSPATAVFPWEEAALFKAWSAV